MIPPPKMRLKPHQKTLLGIATGSVVVLLLLRFVYLPVMGRIGMARTKLADLRVKIADVQGLADRLSKEQQALQGLRQTYLAFERRCGEHQSIARILELLQQHAKTHRVELIAQQPNTNDEEDRVLVVGPDLTLQEIPLTLRLTGRYRQVGDFLGGLFQAPFLASVRGATVKKADAESVHLRTDVLLTVYVAKPSESPR